MEADKQIYYPLFASRLLNGGNQENEEHKKVVEQLMTLDSQKRLSLLSDNMAHAIAVLDQQFHLPEQFVEYIAVLVREMFFGNLTEQDILRALRQELQKVPNLPIDNVIQHVQLHIFQAQPDPEVPEEEETESSTQPLSESTKQYILLDALSKYSNLGNQNITTENIKLKSQVALVRPTLTNWLKNYRDELGIGKHDAVARARFLFESVNTKRLPSNERDRIHALVRSLEDNELLDIDIAKQEILFLHDENQPVSNQIPNQPLNKPEEALSSPDIFERFHSRPEAPKASLPTELQGVGTQTFSGGRVPIEKKEGEASDVLSRIQHMNVTRAQANAPAPQEDFQVPEELPELAPQESLGTMRFSAKHILPAERQEQMARPVQEHRLEHFSPQAVAIPDDGVKSTGPQYSVHAGQEPQAAPRNEPRMSNPVSVTATTPIPAPVAVPKMDPPIQKIPPNLRPQPVAPQSMFRIKPNRD